MTHADDDGLILPPRLAPAHVVLMPILRKEKDRAEVMAYVDRLARELRAKRFHDEPLRVEVDDREIGGGKGWEWIKKGVPVRVEVGPRDIAEDAVFFARRDKSHREKTSMKREAFVSHLTVILDDIQKSLFDRAEAFLEMNTHLIDSRRGFYGFFTPKNPEKPEIHGGFALSHWCGDAACEALIKEELKVTIRCIPFAAEKESGTCVHCGKPSEGRVVFAKAY